ncbi:hypothetical protein HC928_06170 [bacterium]|nr:hypothetical protein [bacterium]
MHAYTESGQYTVTLTVIGAGGQDTSQVTVNVTAPPEAPDANIEVQGATSGETPFDVTFRNTSTGDIDTTLWEFGTGEGAPTSSSSEEFVGFTFDQPGTSHSSPHSFK